MVFLKKMKNSDDGGNCEIVCEQILSWRTEGMYEAFMHNYVHVDMNL